jgi:hypothetical protein
MWREKSIVIKESTGTMADLYVVEIPQEVRRTQERYAAEIDALGKGTKPGKIGKKQSASSTLTEKLDATGRKFSRSMSVKY